MVMDSELIARISPEHLRRITWWYQGEDSAIAEPAVAWQHPSQEILDIRWQSFREAKDDR